MSTRLHALGFASEWTAEMLSQVETLAAAKSKLVGSSKGNYRLWRSQQGAELWFHYPARQTPSGSGRGDQPELPVPMRPVAVTPFHRGLSSCPVKIGRYLSLDRVNPLEGSCMAWLPPQSGVGRGQVMVLELAPYGLHPARTLPFETTAQIVCFAHAVWAYPDAGSYIRETPINRRMREGSINPVTEADVPEVRLSYRQSPITLGLATGTVRRAIRHINPATQQPYYWMLLETKRGTIDVVVNPTQVSGDISEGSVTQVCGSFLARLAGTNV